MIDRVAIIIGDGQMGLVLADALAERGVAVRLWGRSPQSVAELAKSRKSPRLKDFVLRDEIEVTAEDDAVFDGASLILNAVPTQYIRPIWQRLAEHLPEGIPIACVSKGIENTTLLTPTQVIADSIGEANEEGDKASRPLCALSGPTIGVELAKRMPATMVAAAANDDISHLVQDMFSVGWLRVYRHNDLIGVELAGATKNVIALAAGMIDGMEVGYNAKSALLARGLAEIARLGVAMGARVDTFFGVAGVGDLATTCFSPMGRNRICGERIGRGENLDEILSSTASVVEGVPTTRSVIELAQLHKVEMPITTAVNAILFEGLDPHDAITSLMKREPKAEWIG